MFYSPEADALREFFRDKLGMAHFDAGGGWLIFTPSFGEVGFHPSSQTSQDISFVCDDIQSTVADLKAKGVEFTQDVANQGYGLVTYFSAPGGLTIQLYQPLHAKG